LSRSNNPFFEGVNSDWLALIPFAVLLVILLRVGRAKAAAGKM
jgi:hypothetical protein